MVTSIQVHKRGGVPLLQFLEDNDFDVAQITDSVASATRDNELPVLINHKDENIFFEVDIGSAAEVGSQDLFFKLLDANTEILPVSVGINTSGDDPRLVLVESREAENLDENELLSVINALELATDKVEAILTDHL